MLIIQAIILGAIQGLTEFIPVSSSGHLIAIPALMHWKDMGLSFDVSLHFGTLVALVAYFWRDWVKILGRRGKDDAEGRLLVPIIVACIPAAVVGATLDNFIETKLREWYWVAGSLVIFGIVMLLAEKLGKRRRDMARMNWGDYLTIGCAQALALFPGVSRSGITISAGLFRDIDRASAARFSFLMSMPIIFGAAMMKLKDVAKTGIPLDERLPFFLGFLTAALTGYLAIKFLMNYLRTRSLNVFVGYRMVFAVFMVVVFLVVR
ncbi:MAG: undecaprenyl-diphosphatase UppP [Armatimonadetes bacterium]|nr:undecaprenyl-diphosphatase UppP [Armatimonadota bacterium]